MKIIFDTAKDQANIAKHGVSLADATLLDWNSLFAVEDRRHDYDEVRMVGYALISERLYCVVYTDRGVTRRIISLRKANNREKEVYVSNN